MVTVILIVVGIINAIADIFDLYERGRSFARYIRRMIKRKRKPPPPTSEA